jgi:alpha-L-fucosidase 2
MHKGKITAENNTLTSAWPRGSVKGLRARGGFTVHIERKNSQVTHYHIGSPSPRPVTVSFNGELKTVKSTRL